MFAEDGHNGPSYILTADLVESAACVGWVLPKPTVKGLEEDIAALMSLHLPKDWRLQVIPQSELRQQIRGLLADHIAARDNRDRPVLAVFLDTTLCDAGEFPQISITRRCDTGGEDIDHGPRPGYPELNVQAKQIAELANGRAIVLLDDGYWHGTTVRKVADALEYCGATVESALAVLHFDDGNPTVLPLSSAKVDRNNQDWVCMRDLVPGWPLSGRTVKEPVDGLVRGLSYLENAGLSRGSLHHLTPKNLHSLRLGLIGVTIQLFTVAEDTLGRVITVKEMERIPLGFTAYPEDRFIDLLQGWQYQLEPTPREVET